MLLLLHQRQRILNILPLRLNLLKPARHIKVVRRDDRHLRHILRHRRRRIPIRHLRIRLHRLRPLGRFR